MSCKCDGKLDEWLAGVAMTAGVRSAAGAGGCCDAAGFVALDARANAAARKAACKSPAGAGSAVAAAGVNALTDACAIAIVSNPPTTRCDMIKLVGVTSSSPLAVCPGPGDKDSRGAGAGAGAGGGTGTDAPADIGGRVNTAMGGPATLGIASNGGPAVLTAATGGPPHALVGGVHIGGPPQPDGSGGPPTMTLAGGGAPVVWRVGPGPALGAAVAMTDGGGPEATVNTGPHCDGLGPDKVGPATTGVETTGIETTGVETTGVQTTGVHTGAAARLALLLGLGHTDGPAAGFDPTGAGSAFAAGRFIEIAVGENTDAAANN